MKSLLVSLVFLFASISIYAEINYSTDSKCGTFWDKNRKNRLLNHGDIQVNLERVYQQKTFSSPSGKFLIHYDTEGINKVDLKDANQNGIPDYVDSVAYYFDYAWKVQVDSLGFIPPLSDSMLAKGWTPQYDINIFELGTGNDGTYGLCTDDTTIYSGKIAKLITRIIIDNNFSPNDINTKNGPPERSYYTSGMEAVKVTAAHEFNHAIQFSYGIPLDNNFCFSEMTSVAMEIITHPDLHDFVSYVNALLAEPEKYPMSDHTGNSGYSWGIFLYHLSQKYSIDIIKELWETIAKGNPSFIALDKVLAIRNSSTGKEWKLFLPYLYFSGDRLAEWNNLPFAKMYKKLTFKNSYSIADPDTLVEVKSKAYEICANRFVLKNDNSSYSGDTLAIFLTCSDIDYALNMYNSIDLEYTMEIMKDYNAGFNVVPGTAYVYKIGGEGVDKAFIDTAFYNNGLQMEKLAYAFPNPINMKESSEINIPVPEEANYGQTIVIDIFTSDFYPVYSEKLKVVYENNRKVVKFIPKDYLNKSGVYIFKTKYFDNEVMGKFALVE